mmetsp:Transcript_8103/g.30437  ORF Transcript_8103/g.30437 Transcript_8103/m.30437 type:complete len:421 (+) Transcript_8103:3858-5120(+)
MRTGRLQLRHNDGQDLLRDREDDDARAADGQQCHEKVLDLLHQARAPGVEEDARHRKRRHHEKILACHDVVQHRELEGELRAPDGAQPFIQNRGRRKRRAEAERHRLRDRARRPTEHRKHPEQGRAEKAEHHRRRHGLREHTVPRGRVLSRVVHAVAEQQEDSADLTERLHRDDVLNQVQSGRSHDHTAEDESDRRRSAPEDRHENAARRARQHQDDEILEKLDVQVQHRGVALFLQLLEAAEQLLIHLDVDVQHIVRRISLTATLPSVLDVLLQRLLERHLNFCVLEGSRAVVHPRLPFHDALNNLFVQQLALQVFQAALLGRERMRCFACLVDDAIEVVVKHLQVVLQQGDVCLQLRRRIDQRLLQLLHELRKVFREPVSRIVRSVQSVHYIFYCVLLLLRLQRLRLDGLEILKKVRS